ncbi:hypothetical protein Q5P01_014211 [Channa striata]|uniref:Uncharacterized protein n=1 Tax=Channa striata TaxID=64152 RepID=A0AA88MM05_CHASR|nr:hypothetical protein Q5P01_014211 [Channa striata]
MDVKAEEEFENIDSEDGCVEVEATASSDHRTTANQISNYMITRARGNQIASTQQVSSYPLTRRAKANQSTASQQECSDNMAIGNQFGDIVTRGNQSVDDMTIGNQSSDDGMTRERLYTASPQTSGLTGLNDTMNQIPSASNDDYAAYLSIKDSISELSSDDEDLNKAIIASFESNTVSLRSQQHQENVLMSTTVAQIQP